MARILILGTLPSRISIERAEYYANPQNTFWRIMAAGGSDFPQDYGQRAARLADWGIALWDVLAAANRAGSLDADITEPVPNHFRALFHSHPAIRLICFNGAPASGLYRRHVIPTLTDQQRAIKQRTLPSTSSAHARLSLAEKTKEWSIVWEPSGRQRD